MATLKDFITALHNDITLARVSTDMQSVELAKVYGKDEFLRTLDISVPRMKIQDIDVEIKGFVKIGNSDSNSDLKIANSDLIKFANRYFLENLKKVVSEVKYLSESISNTNLKVQRYIDRYIKNQKISFSARIAKVSEQYITIFEKEIKATSEENRKLLDKLYQNLDREMMNHFLKNPELKKPFLNFEFSKEQINSEYQEINFKFKIVEDDLLWEVDKESANEN